MSSRFVVGFLGAVLAAVVVWAVGTHLLADAATTSELDGHSTVTVDGRRALAPDVVANRTRDRFHPLPWVGTEISAVSCPAGLPARRGATLTCTGRKADGTTVRIPVRVTKVTATSMTWVFGR
ncbi:protein of unknown function [Streptomyces sp. 1222.5]|uniref:DUF4333 domain-containing protein n=1 Tax=unclassified Streptomyces TaxID=2593676 RepID=UPI000899EF6C|nr:MULTISPECIES: DUF4333 domain-containing protein [unclassified Streptomyces]PKW11316.1 uncharacterized protein DUF4333 [Streptomyces sp. 5112.2]SEB82183.1 protein of unknown function [Streptomyces sp. 1222.5]SEE08277.1 protein of unknown function [Streptomyces sp. 2231.1]